VKFTYGQKVRITKGFHKYRVGNTYKTISFFYLFRKYLVDFGSVNCLWVSENDLEAAE
jgi:hypothetical protein